MVPQFSESAGFRHGECWLFSDWSIVAADVRLQEGGHGAALVLWRHMAAMVWPSTLPRERCLPLPGLSSLPTIAPLWLCGRHRLYHVVVTTWHSMAAGSLPSPAVPLSCSLFWIRKNRVWSLRLLYLRSAFKGVGWGGKFLRIHVFSPVWSWYLSSSSSLLHLGSYVYSLCLCCRWIFLRAVVHASDFREAIWVSRVCCLRLFVPNHSLMFSAHPCHKLGIRQ
jgi:hypothetical protein